jgi:hypothetical protein
MLCHFHTDFAFSARFSFLDLGSVLGVVNRSLAFVLLKVIHKHTSQLLFHRLVLGGVGPGGARVKNVRIDTWQCLWHFKAKDGIDLEFGIVDGSIQNGINAGTRRLDGHALADTVGTARPSRVDQVRVRAVFVEFLLQQIGVTSGVQGHKGCSKTGRKGGRGLLDATLGSSDLGRVTRQELVHGLTRRETHDRRQDTESIARQEDNVVGVASNLRLVLQYVEKVQRGISVSQ